MGITFLFPYSTCETMCALTTEEKGILGVEKSERRVW